MKTRKMILLASCGILLLVCIFQAVMNAKSPVKNLVIKDSPDFVEISNANGKIELSLDGSSWYVGHDNFQAEKSLIDNIVKTIKEVKVLDTVGKLKSDDFNARYDLNDDKAMTVTAKKGDKVIRTLKVGKASSTGSQSYVTVDGGKDIYLVSGNYQTVYNKDENALKTKTVYNVVSSNIIGAKLTYNGETVEFSKDTTPNAPKVWNYVDSEKTCADDKVSSWITQISICTATEWVDDAKILPKTRVANLNVKTATEEITLEIFSEKDGDATKYICSSNKTPHRFEIAETAVAKYQKGAKDFNGEE